MRRVRPHALVLAALAALAACSSAQFHDPDAHHVDAAAIDARVVDATDAATDAPDARTDDGAGCAINAGDSPVLDGDGDLAAYPASQVMTPGVPTAAGDRVALTWDPANLYVTVTSASFAAGEYRPLHVYLQSGTTLAAAAPSTGKEYSNLTPQLPFTPTHLIAIRRRDDSGIGGPYDGVYLPAASWTTRSFALVPGSHVFVSADGATLSAKVPWSALGGCPTAMRLAVHVVNAEVANEWKDAVPTTHTPWLAPGGGYYQLDLTGDPAIAGWTLH